MQGVTEEPTPPDSLFQRSRTGQLTRQNAELCTSSTSRRERIRSPARSQADRQLEREEEEIFLEYLRVGGGVEVKPESDSDVATAVATATSSAITLDVDPESAHQVAPPRGYTYWCGRYQATDDRLRTEALQATIRRNTRHGLDLGAHEHHNDSPDHPANRGALDDATRRELVFEELRGRCRTVAARESLRLFRQDFERRRAWSTRREEERERIKKAAKDEPTKSLKAVLVKEELDGQARRKSGLLGKMRQFSQSRLPKFSGRK